MQRCLFFIFCFSSISVLHAQSINITKTEIAMWYAGSQASANTKVIKARAFISFTGQLSSTNVELEVADCKVLSVVKKEGREKDQLTYRLENQQLKIELPIEIGRKYQIVVDYEINLNSSFIQNYLQHTTGLLVMNPFNARGDMSLGAAGVFYPSLLGDESIMLLNITLSENKSIGFRGVIEFETDNQDGTKSQYWRSDGPITPEAFYFVMGEFKEFEAEDLDEEFELSAMELRKMKIFNAKKDMLMAIDFLGINPVSLTDSEFAYVDSLSGLSQTGFFIIGNEPDLGISNKDLSRVKALILYTNKNDTVNASQEVYNLFAQKNDKNWEESLMDWKWEQRNTLSTKDAQRVLQFRLERWRSSNPELFSALSTSETDTALLKPMLSTFSFPHVLVSYRYVAGDTALFINYVQDTSKAPAYPLPVKVTLVSGDGTHSSVQKLTAIKGKLKIRSAKIPKAASVSFGKHFPGRVEEKKPDTYLLYQLRQAQTAAERKEALIGLFKTNNPNLFSTALGIAMRDVDSELQILALKNAQDLNLPAQQKLQGGIELLAQDEDMEISTLAKSLVSKYYGAK